MPMITATFASSDGWSWNMPRSNQPWEPLWDDPSGDSTNTSSAMEMP